MRPPAQSLNQYLDQILASRGSHAVPYQEATKWAVRDHLIEVQKVFPSLAIKLNDFHANDGRLLHLLKADGTIPIHYQGNKYNIPVVIWLPERYPYEAPLPYVVPTPNMVIKGGHPYVDRNGQVTTPGVRAWSFPTSNLVDLTLEMSRVFGNDPPLYSQPGAPGGAASAVAAGDARPGASVGPGGATNPPPSYPPPSGYAQPPPGYPPYGSQLPPARPPAPPAGAGAYGAPGAGGPAPYGSNTSQGSSNPYPSFGDQSTLASNPLWGAAFAAANSGGGAPPGYQRTNTGSSAGGVNSFSSQQGAPTPSGQSTASTASGSFGMPPPAARPPAYGAQQSSAAAAALAYGGMQPPPPPPPPMFGMGGYPPPGSGLGGGAAGPAQQQQQQPQQPPPPPSPPKPQVRREELEREFRPLAVAALRPQLEAAARAYQQHAKAETEAQLEAQAGLRQRKAALEAQVAVLKQERAGTEGLVKEMGSKTAQLQQWLDRNEPKVAAISAATAASGGVIEWDKVVVPADELARQALEAQAQDLAYEDTLLALDKAMMAGVGGLSVEAYLKQVRALCRKQFYARALGIKVAQAQAARPPPQPHVPGSGTSVPYPMAHGDSWVGAGGLAGGAHSGGMPPPRPLPGYQWPSAVPGGNQ
eukprot:CAMPEP_0202860114 /NCGR_PEP_ID=MMETSP1391-20130828/1960_1 /ASSEMBLY_ACC=CAM_ASM_000867 /TAXON_ID=1034604 /ORGANISM="Chlamydomonas leiostraca, Strain SAG 11-49" /LENGTH=642 /DNA_ID=CAMNT_0049539249 /DNA_START=110 /DNA_END=2038 /DNA_ORIENTATION=-